MSEKEICPVCLGDEDEMMKLSCGHHIHEGCCVGLTSMKCILCDEEMSNLPSDIQTQIKENSKKRMDEMIEEDRQSALDIVRNGEQVESGTILIVPPYNEEAECAIQYLQEQGVPFPFLPRVINIYLPDNPTYPPGAIFETIVKKVMEEVQLSTSSNSSEEENSESDEDEHPSEPQTSNTQVNIIRV